MMILEELKRRKIANEDMEVLIQNVSESEDSKNHG